MLRKVDLEIVAPGFAGLEFGCFGCSILIRIIEAGSPQGLWKQIRHRVFKTPAFIIDRKTTYVGWDLNALQALIDERVLSSC